MTNASRTQASQSHPTRSSQVYSDTLNDDMPSTSLDDDEGFNLALGMALGNSMESGSDFDITSILSNSIDVEGKS